MEVVRTDEEIEELLAYLKKERNSKYNNKPSISYIDGMEDCIKFLEGKVDIR